MTAPRLATRYLTEFRHSTQRNSFPLFCIPTEICAPKHSDSPFVVGNDLAALAFSGCLGRLQVARRDDADGGGQGVVFIWCLENGL